jgi:CRISPR-associated protein Cmr4
VIPSSTIKGVLRDAFRRQTEKKGQEADHDPHLVAAFGPPSGDSGKHAGALCFTDGRVLGFPVRSLRGVFAWITCPAVLERLSRDLRLGNGQSSFPAIPTLGKNETYGGDALRIGGDKAKIILEEFEFTRKGEATPIAAWIAEHALRDEDTKKRLKQHLAILHDDDFTHFVRHATEIVARVGLDYERKTVRQGALFYQELLPAETLFYSLVLASASRKEEVPLDGGRMMDYLKERLPPLLQIGGDETIGKGLCTTRLFAERGA